MMVAYVADNHATRTVIKVWGHFFDRFVDMTISLYP